MKSSLLLCLCLMLWSCKDANKEQHTQATAIPVQLYSGPIIDMHIHAYSDESGGFMFGMPHPLTLRGESFKAVESADELKKETLERFKKHNIVKAVVTNGNLWNEHKSDVFLNAYSQWPLDSLKAGFESGKLDLIAEVAPFYNGIKADDEIMTPLFDLAEEMGIPMGYHIFPGGPPGGLYLLGMKDMKVANANPLQIEEVLISHPNLKIYMMHGGWPYLEDMKALMYAHPQLYIDLGAISWVLSKKEFHFFLKGLVDAGYGKRIMYGTDQMAWPQTIDIGIETVNSADYLTLEQKEDIFYNNAAVFLGLSEEEIHSHKSNSEN